MMNKVIIGLMLIPALIIIPLVIFIIITVTAILGSNSTGLTVFDIPADAVQTAISQEKEDPFAILAGGKLDTDSWKNYKKSNFEGYVQAFDEKAYTDNLKNQDKYEVYKGIKMVYGLYLKDTYSIQKVISKGSESKKINKKVCFPISNKYRFTYSNDFGGNRVNDGKNMGHEGNDIFTNRNTPILAIEDGYIDNFGWDGLGGWTIELVSKNKNRRYYYAHMERYVDKLAKYMSVKLNGKINVKRGDVIGYVGSSGAFNSDSLPGSDTGTLPHIHLQMWIHIDGKDVLVNPYNFLKYLE